MTISYDPVTGAFTKDGHPHGTVNAAGYVVMRYEGKVVYGHRLAWFLTHGEWPSLLDHVNGDRADNRMTNLRLATRSLNARNRVTKVRGAHFHKPSGCWKSAIQVDGRSVHLGYYPNADHATEAYLLAKELFHNGVGVDRA